MAPLRTVGLASHTLSYTPYTTDISGTGAPRHLVQKTCVMPDSTSRLRKSKDTRLRGRQTTFIAHLQSSHTNNIFVVFLCVAFCLPLRCKCKYSDTCIHATSKSKGKSKVSEEDSDENLEASVLILRLNLFKCLIEWRSYKPRLPQVFINFL
jgi:hypothetical protein